MSLKPLILTEAVEPIGTRTVRGFACRADGSAINEWTEPEYPDYPDGRALRQLRLDLQLILREAAAILGMSATDLSALERGRRRFVQGSFERACEVLRGGVSK